MERLTLTRKWKSDDTTIGELRHGSTFIAYTLEDRVREVKGEPVSKWKVRGRTAIPEGTYDVVINLSNRFHKYMPQLLNVPGFEGIRIHAGNTAADTEGCLILGLERLGSRAVTDSRLAINKLDDLLEDWDVTDVPGRCQIEIKSEWVANG